MNQTLFSSLCICLLAAVTAAESSEEPRVFLLQDFGVYPSSDEDVGIGIRSVLSEVKDLGIPAVIRLAPGEYRISPEEGISDALVIKNMKNLTIEGAGSSTRIVVTDPTVGGIRFQNCVNVRIADLVIDYDPAPFTQGTIMHVDLEFNSFEINCDEGFLEPGAPCFVAATDTWGLVVEPPETGREQYGPIPIYAQSWTRTVEGAWRCQAREGQSLTHAAVRPGARFVYMARLNIGAGVTAWSSRQVELERVTVHAAPSLATLWGLTEDITIRSLHVEPTPGTGRLLSTNADGIHSLGNRDTLLIEGCYFNAMADDAINIHARTGTPVEQISPATLRVNPGGCVEYRVGDRLQIYDPENGVIRYPEVTITEVEEEDWFTFITLNQSLEGIVTGPSFKEADHIFNLDACGAGALIRNNHFGIHRGRGILIKSTDTIIEQNTFQNREGWCIAMHQLQDWGEGPAAQRITIRENRFEGVSSGWSPFIDIRPSKRGNLPAEGRPVQNIHIENNQMINPSGGVLHAAGVQGLTLINNKITADAGSRVREGPLLALISGGDIQVRGLIVHDYNENTTAVIYVADGVDAGERGIHIEDMHTDLYPGIERIRRENEELQRE